ncbi:hypothetical protein EIP86_004750 [Pleurotus ostreatoroseus]|nr:hypothetical protein EIP86_004750 [Pleurotus ostreatoroseus]
MKRTYDYGFVQRFSGAHDIPTIPTRSLRQTSATLAAHPQYAFGNYMINAPPQASFVHEDTAHITARLLQDRMAADGDHDLQSNVWYQPVTTPERNFWQRLSVPIHAPIPVTPTRRPLAGLGISFGQHQEAMSAQPANPQYVNKPITSGAVANAIVAGTRPPKRKASVLYDDGSPMAVDSVPPGLKLGEVAAYSTCPSADYAAQSSFEMIEDPSPFCPSYSPTDDVLMMFNTPAPTEPLDLPLGFTIVTPALNSDSKGKSVARMMDLDTPKDDAVIGLVADVNLRTTALATQPQQLCVNPADLSGPSEPKSDEDMDVDQDVVMTEPDNTKNDDSQTGARWPSPDLAADFPDDAVTAIVSVLAASAKDETSKTGGQPNLFMPAPALPQHMGARQGHNMHPSAFPSRSAYGLGIQFGAPPGHVAHAPGPAPGPSAAGPRMPLAPISNETKAQIRNQQAPVLNAHEGVELDDLRVRAETFRMLNPGCELDKTFLQAFAGRLSERGELLPEFRCYVKGCSQRNKRRDHILVHVGSHVEHRPFQCPQCGMRFLRKNECKRHMSSHGGYKPYTCNLCAPFQVKSFVRQDLLKRHMKVTHGVLPEQWPDRRRRKMNQAAAAVEEAESPVVEDLMYPDDCGACLYYFLWPSGSRHAPTLADAVLSPLHFTPVTVYASEPCADGDTRLITLEVPKDALPASHSPDASTGRAPLAPVWSVFIKDDDIQVERPYTPLEGLDAEGRMRFWVKQYEKGEVARWLHTKQLGEHVEIRGPVQTWAWREGVWDEVIMISGGTGITPFYQLVHQTLLAREQERRDDNATSGRTRFTLLHSSCTPGELPPPSVLGPLVAHSQEHPDELKVSLFVDKLDGSRTDSAPMDRVQVGRIGMAAVRSALGYGNDTSWWKEWLLGRWGSPQPTGPTGKRILVLVCGPEA